MHICLVSREYPTDDHAGGIATYTEKTARGLARLGQRVTVIIESRGEASTSMEEGVSVVRLERPRVKRLRTIAWARAVSRAIRALPDPPDIVQASEHRAEALWYAFRKQPRTRLITRLATPSFIVQDLNRTSHVGALRTRVYIDWLERLQAYRSDAIISLSQALADVVCRRWKLKPERLTTIPNGVDFARRYAASAAELPEELRDRQYLLYFGRLEERKGVHILAQALPQILQTHPNLHVVFAGNNLMLYQGRPMQNFVESCNAAYRDRLHFFPRLPQSALYPILQHASIVVLPSLWEALGNVSLEALDMGRPVIATRGCGFGEIIEDGVSGILTPPGDVDALRGAIVNLLGDPARLASMSQSAFHRAEEFGLERMTRRLLDLYEATLGRPATTVLAGGSNGPDLARVDA
jgi:glycosyltransferase involved in cell wall biosynthesis